MSNKTTCDYDGHSLIGVEYTWDHPDHYDGVSEWQCVLCNRRWGRWSRRELADGETEPPFGRHITTDQQTTG